MAYTTAELKALAKQAEAAGATADDIAKFVSDQGIDPAQVAEVYNVTEESVSKGLEAYKSGGSAADVTYTPQPASPPPEPEDTYTPPPPAESKAPPPPVEPEAPPGLGAPEPVTLDSGYTLTKEEEEYRGNLATDQQPIYDLLLDNKGKSNEEITKALVDQNIPLDKAFAVVGITDPEVQGPFKVAYRKARAEAGQNPSFDAEEYDAYMANAKALVDSGAITEAQAYENMLIEVKRLREEGYSITDEELAESINKAFGQTLSPEDVNTFIAGTPEEPEIPIEPEVLEELGAIETTSGNIVVGTPQVGEVNILDFMGLRAAQPTLTEGTKLTGQINEIDSEKVGTLLSDISAEDSTKLSTGGNYVTEPEGITAKQVTAPTAKDAVTGVAQQTDLVNQPDVAKTTAVKSLEQVTSASDALVAARQDLNEIDPRATVVGQMAMLQEHFANERTPVWAQGAMRQVNSLMAQRGLGSSTIAAEAITNALMQSALPIAQQDASFYQNVTIQNLSNEQQVRMEKFNSQVAAIFNDQAAENTARNLNMQAENQMTQFFTELSQNVALANTSQVNAMEQFNATAQNQMTQFYEELGLTAETFNAEQINEMAQFDAEQLRIVQQFNAELDNQREQYNINNQLNIDANNVQWRRDANTANTSAKNAALQFDATNLLDIQNTALSNIWNHFDTVLNYAFQSEENEKDRAAQLMLTNLSADLKAAMQQDSDLMDLFGIAMGSAVKIGTSKVGIDWVGDLLDF